MFAAANTNHSIMVSVVTIARRPNCTTARCCASFLQHHIIQPFGNHVNNPIMAVRTQRPSPPPPAAAVRLPLLLPLQLQQVRYKRHAAKMGHHLETLDDMAHEKSRQEAQERRQKKKDKKAARKGGGGDKKMKDSSSLAGRAVDKDDDLDDDDDSDNEDNNDDDEKREQGDIGDDDVLTLPDPEQVKERMMKIVNRFAESLKTMRGAEPTVELFDDVVVNAYGSSNTSLKSVALVVLESPTLAVATCYDPALAKNVCTALQEKLELNPSIVEDSSGGGGATIRIPLPRVSMETRQKTAAALKKRAEAHRQQIRKHRRAALDIVKKTTQGGGEGGGGISKDDAFRVKKEIETMTDQVIHKLNEIADKKHDSIMSV
jgi:ribosome recycling factor